MDTAALIRGSLTVLPGGRIVWTVKLDLIDYFGIAPMEVYVSPWGTIIETEFGNDLTHAINQRRSKPETRSHFGRKEPNKTVHRTIHSAALSGESKLD